MRKFNEELVKAGIMLAGEGLQPTAKGKRIRFSRQNRTIVDGPFTETKELIAGFWLWQVRSMNEAVEWLKRCPNRHAGESGIEIRQVFEAEDFGSELIDSGAQGARRAAPRRSVRQRLVQKKIVRYVDFVTTRSTL